MKKALIFILSSMLLLTACNSNSIKELEEAIEKTNSVNSSRTKMEGSIELVPNADLSEEEKMMINTMGKMSINMEMEQNKELVKSKVNFGMSGTSMDMEMFMDGERNIIKMPTFDKYVVSPLVTVEAEGKEDARKEEAEELTKELLNVVMSKIKSGGNVKSEDSEVDINGEKTKVKKLSLNFKDDAAKEMLIEVIEKAYSSESFLNNMELQTGKKLTEEETAKNIEDMKVQLEKITILGLEYIVYVNEDKYIVGQDIKVEIKINEPEAEEKVEVEALPVDSWKIDLKMRSWDFDKDIEIIIPEITAENSITQEELTNQMSAGTGTKEEIIDVENEVEVAQ